MDLHVRPCAPRCHDRPVLSSPAFEAGWRRASSVFSISGFAGRGLVARCFGSAAPVTAASGIAPSVAVSRLDAGSGARPTAGTSEALKDDWIIATGRGPTV